mmetsp:Transcript_33089/g.55391  ORF Transcript_33089/g.55391 Transcript_33089/m.55391 type:complete len:92 (+) Transcript_33089:410-685(+)
MHMIAFATATAVVLPALLPLGLSQSGSLPIGTEHETTSAAETVILPPLLLGTSMIATGIVIATGIATAITMTTTANANGIDDAAPETRRST